VPLEEREAFWEKLYASPGFGIWMGNFSDMLTDRAANAAASDFIARKIRQRVHDPVVAEKLIPKNHGFGTRRVPLETGYYEVYNQSNVELVDINDTPIERITPTGIKTSDRAYEFDIIIYATGFDAITGAFDRIDIRSAGGMRLKDVWKDGPQTYLGVLVEGFPNMLMAMGPHAGLGNYTRTAEYSVEWVTGLIQFATERGLTRIEATADGVAEWTDYVLELGQGQLMNEIASSTRHRQHPLGFSTEFDPQVYSSVSLICCPIPDSRDRIHDVVGSDADAAPQYMSICHSGSAIGGGNITRS
jgi:cation diffusion facilitator CzcD-associated flavoprotein CzcO